MLVKEFYINMTQKTNKEAITIQTTVKGIPVTFYKALLSQIATTPDEGPNITFVCTSRVIFGDTEWNHASACGRVRIRNHPNLGLPIQSGTLIIRHLG